ncbi:glycosyltransferase family 39 protein [Candidatus Poribacteria bacterium]|nr:glycosyltransferase family 39 protein [Candidatus Poribacteria bacterium]
MRTRLAVAALLAIHLALAVGSMRRASLTWDEPSYIGIGRQLLETRNWEIVALQLHPPLPYYVNSLLLLPLKLDPDRFEDKEYVYRRYIGPSLIFESGQSPRLMMFLTRIPFVFLSALLGLLVYRWGREIYGSGAALVSLFLYSLCPAILAHCKLATPDMLLAFTMTLALYSFHKYLQAPSAVRMVLTGMALGLALLSKFTGLILIPILLLEVILFRLVNPPSPPLQRGETGEPLRGEETGTPLKRVEKAIPLRIRFSLPPFAKGGRGDLLCLLLILLIASCVVWAGYGFQFGTPFMPQWLKPQAERLVAEKPFWQAVDALALRGIRIPAYSYILGIYTQLAAAKGWKDNFLFGEISRTGWWYFYWVAFLIKTPIPFIICLVAAAGASLKSSRPLSKLFSLEKGGKRACSPNPPSPPLHKGSQEGCPQDKVVPSSAEQGSTIPPSVKSSPAIRCFVNSDSTVPPSAKRESTIHPSVKENSISSPFGKGGKGTFDERFLLFSILIMIGFFSLPSRINIGIRYILPLIPLLCIFAGKVASFESKRWKRALAILCVWYAGSAAWIYPHYLAYFNEMIGGPSKGYKYLVDSNLDWGQNLNDLMNYLQENRIRDVKIKYFGPRGVLEYYGLSNADLNGCEPSAGVWAVSATYLQNLYLANPHCHDWLKKLKPRKVLGYSIFIYDVPAGNP